VTDEVPTPAADEPPPYLIHAWRRDIPDITTAEVRALLPIVQQRPGWLRSLALAYRAGVRDATPLDPPLSGFQPCPGCLSVRVATVAFDGMSGAMAMLARCADCHTLYVASTGEPVSTSTLTGLDTDRQAPGA
jgi:hypothetical protein